MHITDSLCYTAELTHIVKQLYSNKDVKKKNLFIVCNLDTM